MPRLRLHRRTDERDQDGDGGEPDGVRHTGVSAQSDVVSDPILPLAGRNRYEKKRVAKSPVPDPLRQSTHRRKVRRAWKELLASADLPYVRIHDLRHTAATLLLTQGVHPRVVMETLGHSQIGVTLDTYSHVLPVLQRDAADEMDKALGRASGG